MLAKYNNINFIIIFILYKYTIYKINIIINILEFLFFLLIYNKLYKFFIKTIKNLFFISNYSN